MNINKPEPDSWIPATPSKPILPNPLPLHANSQEFPLDHAILLGQSGTFSFGCTQESLAGETAACSDSSNSMELNRGASNGEALPQTDIGIKSGNDKTCRRFFSDAATRVQNDSCADLCSLADAANAMSKNTAMEGSDTGAPDELQLPHQHASDHNCSLRTLIDAFSGDTTTQFAPITPEKFLRVNGKKISEEHEVERTNQEIAVTRVDTDGFQCEGELLKPFADSTLTAANREDHNPDKGGRQGIDQNKTSQQKPRRKKHRPKVVTEGKPKRTAKSVTPKPASKDNPTVKRKYVRRKGLNLAPTAPPVEAAEGSSDTKTIEPTKTLPRRSCRRVLNFDIDGQPREGCSACQSTLNLASETQAQSFCSGGNHPKSTVHQVMVEKSPAGIAYNLHCSVNQNLKEYISLPDKHAPGTPPPSKTRSIQRKRDAKSQEHNNCKKGQMSAQNGQDNIVRIMFQTDSQFLPKGPQDSNCSTHTILTGEVQARVSKRKVANAIEQADTCCTNIIGINYNTLPAYQMMPTVHFPSIFKKKRTEKGQNWITSGISSSVTYAQNVAKSETTCSQNNVTANHSNSETNYWIFGPQSSGSGVRVRALQNELQTSQSFLAFNGMERSTSKRSRCPTRVRDFKSLARIKGCMVQPTYSANQTLLHCEAKQGGNSQQPNTSIENLVTEMHKTLTRKKRTKKRISIVNSASSSANTAHTNQKIIFDDPRQFSANLLGALPETIWNQILPIDAVIEKLKLLDINRENSHNQIVYQQQNALVCTNAVNHEHNALVLYQRDGTVVPFEGSFDPIKKRRPRPKVDLDEETNRVWKLLMGNINSEGIDGTDEEKAKWWEEERRVFRGRANSFIARMHLVQGDRRFSQWKGSVVDSVVGVFLTQNVSDHLSSSAFMSMAAHFPLKSKSNHKRCSEERTNSVSDELLVCMVDSEDSRKWDEKMADHPASDQSSMTLHDTEHSEEKEVVNSTESSRNSIGIVSSVDVPKYKSMSSSESSLGTCYNSPENRLTKEITETETECHIAGDQRVRNGALSYQNSLDYPVAQTAERKGSFSESNSEAEDLTNVSTLDSLSGGHFTMLLKMAQSKLLPVCSHGSDNVSSDESLKHEHYPSQTLEYDNQRQSGQGPSSSSEHNQSSNTIQEDNNMIGESQIQKVGHPSIDIELLPLAQDNERQHYLNLQSHTEEALEITDSTNASNIHTNTQQMTEPHKNEHSYSTSKELNEINAASLNLKNRKLRKEKKDDFDWDSLRKQAEASGRKRERTADTMDSLDWEAVRCADVNDIANTIKERGMNNMLAERIRDFLNRLVREHGSIDLEWLRDVPPDKAKEYLLSIRGLGLKSVECVRLLTLHHLAFPVDTNVGRIAVRLGWVPLQPLPESLQLHLLELYPVLESIQKYLWPRLCKLDQRTLYELHYQMITFGKVFCTKSKPNCNACPMRGECRHFASAFASARLSLPGLEEKSIVTSTEKGTAEQIPAMLSNHLPLSLPQPYNQPEKDWQSGSKSGVNNCEPIIEEPATPEPECTQVSENDIEDALCEDPDEIPTIKLNIEEFTQNLQNYMQENMELQEGEMSKALVALTAGATSIPVPKLKNVSRLRTEHQVYELPDSHPLLQRLDRREPDDPCSYLLAIWTPGETANSIQPPVGSCCLQEYGQLCDERTCFFCNSKREAESQIVRATLLIPCRTAMRGSFPLNGTYFQVNEVFADHDSSLNPIAVPRSWIWNLPRRTVYFGTSIPTIFKGLTTEGIQHCFWRGYVCVRGFDQKTRAPRPLMARLHFPASKLTRAKGTTDAGDK